MQNNNKIINKLERNLNEKSKEKYSNWLNFLTDLVNNLTNDFKITNKKYYNNVDRHLKGNKYLGSLTYSTHGLSSTIEVIDNYILANKSDNWIYEISPYLSSFSNLILIIYKESINILGKEKALEILKSTFERTKEAYNEIPNLRGYLPPIVVGISSSDSSSAFGVRIMDNMIDFIVEDFIEKKGNFIINNIDSNQGKSREQITNEVKQVYIEYIGPLGAKIFDKLNNKANKEEIIKQIDNLTNKDILGEEKAESFKNEIKSIWGGGIQRRREYFNKNIRRMT